MDNEEIKERKRKRALEYYYENREKILEERKKYLKEYRKRPYVRKKRTEWEKAYRKRKQQKFIDLQQRIDKAVEWCECVVNAKYTSDRLPNGQTTDMGYCLDLAEPLLKILKGDDTNDKN